MPRLTLPLEAYGADITLMSAQQTAQAEILGRYLDKVTLQSFRGYF